MPFNGERVKQAREANGWSQEELANRVAISQPHISRVEQNFDSPSEALIEAVALATGFAVGFFQKPSGPEFPLGSLLFRRTRELSSQGTAELRQTARLIVEAVSFLGKRFKPLQVALPPGSRDVVETAQLVRSTLGISPDGPVSGLIRKLERAGVLVIYLPNEVPGFEAFSSWTDELPRRPVICLRRDRPGDRIRRTLAHELGHLVQHGEFLGAPGRLEEEAFDFAGEFLFPRAAMRNEISTPLTLTQLSDLKRRWGVSMAAIAQDAELRAIITSRQKQYIRAKLASKGWLEFEPVPIPVEAPKVLRQMIDSAYPDDGARRLARDLGVPHSWMDRFLEANSPVASEPARTLSSPAKVGGGTRPLDKDSGEVRVGSLLEFSRRRERGD